MSSPRADREADRTDEITAEQQYVSMLYAKLDELRRDTTKRLTETLRQTGGTPQARTERDISTTMYTDKLTQLSAVEHGLCFGRLDLDSGEVFHVGRLGLFDEEDEYEPLLIDWRAPAARPFYLATAAARDGVRRRRHLRTRWREVVDFEDEVLDLDAAEQGSDLGLAGEATLLAALDARRTGQMGDIVATIQAEQDQIIRAGMNGVLVVQGGPGTGKTAVALHRAAYLLYTFREQLTKRGVLVVGPNSTFLRYIGQVLPSLGETGVLLSTVGGLFPGITATAAEPARAAEIKGWASMVDVLTAAVRDRQQAPKDHIEVQFDREPLRIQRRDVTHARTRARRSRKPHNLARRVFLQEMFSALTTQVADRLGRDLLDRRDLDEINVELRGDPAVVEALDGLWPELTPQEVLDDLLSSPERLTTAARKHLDPGEREELLREPGAEWTPADVPLLDELAELLGVDDAKEREERARQAREELAYAQGVLHIMEQDEEIADEERLRVSDVLDAELLAERHQTRSDLTAAERAAEDRTWTFGHVIVDEAQELSEMAWRVLMRRCPSRSMTLVGDIAQTGAPGGARSWHEVLGPYVADRWKLAELTVNYRTPAEIMTVAADVLDAMDTELEAPTSVRSSGHRPWLRHVAEERLATELPGVVADELHAVGDGRLAVLLPPERLAELGGKVAEEVPGTAVGTRPDGLESPAVLLTVEQAKGLEFDSVLVVDPAGVVEESERGLNDLYVALTRATQRLGVVHTGEVPDVLGALS
ncbi:DNA helicase IV [Saccharopolyspora erythraea NRRL 2338]|uniref:ATP-dependent DNA helicase n=2 Tax=Saccharopolyspora erythraea TaxID=1836 RepID=A4FLJ0_SACEN|nr:ATP-binding domain-containing protein [Saccharopolyspora erythraea]EQD85278.1 ATP-dependent DNA helicase [Saccharopolyspora erythraea D]PFG98555.1 DNA helicase IV [Saccharopolyspora erythraea NRRL 2338]QRK88596.1 AAA family ATPase [Saccharopolyspora erythraea]CAM04915.1 ATP-dependent DNA helicase [Saccharopolyspora erythraea NRRL 2338]